MSASIKHAFSIENHGNPILLTRDDGLVFELLLSKAGTASLTVRGQNGSGVSSDITVADKLRWARHLANNFIRDESNNGHWPSDIF